MAKAKRSFFCKECGYESSGWLGKCPACTAWNSFVEAPPTAQTPQTSRREQAGGWLKGTGAAGDQVVSLAKISAEDGARIASGLSELDRVLGGGLVPGSLLLLGGDPGVGKSTLLLQLMAHLASRYACLYVSGEESPGQIRLRCERLGLELEHLELLPSTNFEQLEAVLRERKPQFVVVDSIQTLDMPSLEAAPGSPSQLRESTAALLRLAKGLNICILLIGHVTKDGAIAGPRMVEHMVDTVLYFEGSQGQQLRLLRAVKNRFGSTDELGLFEMSEQGLNPVPAAETALLDGRPVGVPGTVVSCQLEGTRPLLLEIQALVHQSSYAQAIRMTQGFERLRLSMLLAVLEKFSKLQLSNLDCYVNVAGGLRLHETVHDLAVLLAVVSSLEGQALPADLLILGEVGLSGEIRAVSQTDKRVQEAARLGFRKFILPSQAERKLNQQSLPEGCTVYFVSLLTEALDIILSHSEGTTETQPSGGKKS